MPKHKETTQPEAKGKSQFQRTHDFSLKYANSVRYEQTLHDLTLIFGQSDFSSGVEVVKQHTAVTVPWAVAKLAAYFIGLNVQLSEVYNGPITIHPQQIPQPFEEPTAEQLAEDPDSIKAFELGNKIREQFIKANFK